VSSSPFDDAQGDPEALEGSNRVRLGAVGYLNARPLVYGLDRISRFDLRYDVPSECARLLHEGAIDVGLIPSIEYLRGGPYRIVPDLAIASRGSVASVAIYTTKPMADVRSIAMDTSSRTSVALAGVLCARLFKIAPAIEARGPDLPDMLATCDAALIIGDNALLLEHPAPGTRPQAGIEKIDLGEAWTTMTGLPFVYAFWAGRADALTAGDVEALQRARNGGVTQSDAIAREYFPDSPAHQAVGARYLRDNIQYYLRDDERAGLEAFYRYAAEAGLVQGVAEVRFYGQP
jgi:chorismate dehydratase